MKGTLKDFVNLGTDKMCCVRSLGLPLNNIKTGNSFRSQHGLPIGELQILCNVILAPGILAWFCLIVDDN